MGFSNTYCIFALNVDYVNSECNSIQGFVRAYHNVLRAIQFHVLANFSEIIKNINYRCEAIDVSQYSQEYYLLLIVTDGIISDLEKTIDQIMRGFTL